MSNVRGERARRGTKVVSSSASIILTSNGKLADRRNPAVVLGARSAAAAARAQFLRIPPFPGSRVSEFEASARSSSDPAELAELIQRLKVGGAYWAAQPDIPRDHVTTTSVTGAAVASHVFPERPIVLMTMGAIADTPPPGVVVVKGPCDPWHILARSAALITDCADDLRLIAALLNVPCVDAAGTLLRPSDWNFAERMRELAETSFVDPFSGRTMDALEATRLCGFWRHLIDANRTLAGGVGFAFWKQDHVAPLLWGGSDPFRFLRSADLKDDHGAIAVWRAKAPPALLRHLELTARPLIEVEDGFLRSSGLGADCVPPLSITVDRMGAHFDPAQPSELELLLQDGAFDEATIERARRLRSVLVEEGIGKYDRGRIHIERPGGSRRHILVPGQVEDDRAVKAGGCGLTSNLELLRRVRAAAPDAYIIYKPHPDVLAGHRRGSIPDRSSLRYADKIVGDLSMASIIGAVDEVHVNTSLAGFEALLQQKRVTTHGVPFYAGWGLTHDLGSVPKRRTTKRTIDELVAATLLLYPRYLDPVTRLPCPAEIVVQRLTGGHHTGAGLVIGMRRLQGKLMRRLRSLVQ